MVSLTMSWVKFHKVATRIFPVGVEKKDLLHRIYTKEVMVDFSLVMLELFVFETEDAGTHMNA